MWGFQFLSHPCPHLDFSIYLILAMLVERCYFIIVLLCLSLVVYEHGHFFTWFILWMFSFMNCLFKPLAHFSIVKFLFLWSSLLVLNVKNIFPHSFTCLFNILMVSYELNISFMISAFFCQFKPPPQQDHEDTLLHYF